jgi:hypothetical protein
MIDLNSSIAVIFIEDRISHCHERFPNYSNLHFKSINTSELFQEYLLPVADSSDTSSNSNILKLLVAHKYQFTYIELGIHFLSVVPQDFSEQMFLSLPIWNHMKCSQQLSNLAFCLSQSALEDLLKEVRESFSSRTPMDYATSLLTQTLPNRYPLRLLSLNHPEVFTLPEVLTDYNDYQHKLLYLPLSFASSHPSLATISYRSYVDALRDTLGFTALSSPPTTNSVPLFPSSPLFYEATDQVFSAPVLEAMLEAYKEPDSLLPLFTHVEHLLENAKWKSIDLGSDRDILLKVQSSLSSLCRHSSAVIRRRSLQLLFLFDLKPL